MTDSARVSEQQPNLAGLLGGLIDDMHLLFRQEVALARREFQEEWTKTKTAACLMLAGVTILSLAAVLFGFMFVKLLGLVIEQEWLCFGIVGLALAVTGSIAWAVAYTTFKGIRVLPERTVESMERNLDVLTQGGNSEVVRAGSEYPAKGASS